MFDERLSFLNVRDLWTFVINQRWWFKNVCGNQTVVIYKHSWFTNLCDFLTFMNFHCSWFKNICDSQTIRRSWTARCVKPRISVDLAAFMFRVVICPRNMCSTKVDNQAKKSLWHDENYGDSSVSPRTKKFFFFFCKTMNSYVSMYFFM